LVSFVYAAPHLLGLRILANNPDRYQALPRSRLPDGRAGSDAFSPSINNLFKHFARAEEQQHSLPNASTSFIADAYRCADTQRLLPLTPPPILPAPPPVLHRPPSNGRASQWTMGGGTGRGLQTRLQAWAGCRSMRRRMDSGKWAGWADVQGTPPRVPPPRTPPPHPPHGCYRRCGPFTYLPATRHTLRRTFT